MFKPSPVFRLRWMIAFLLLVSVCNVSKAGVMIAMDDRGANLQNLNVGDQFKIDFVLSGLGPVDELSYLAVTANFDANFLDASDPIFGVIVPDANGFVGSHVSLSGLGFVDGNYDAIPFSSPNIEANNIFMTVTFTAKAVGSGSIAFDLPSLAASDINNDSVQIDGGDIILFDVNSGSSTVPEPTTWLVFSILACAALRKRMTLHGC